MKEYLQRWRTIDREVEFNEIRDLFVVFNGGGVERAHRDDGLGDRLDWYLLHQSDGRKRGRNEKEIMER